MQGRSALRVLSELLFTDYVSRTALDPGSWGGGGGWWHEGGRQRHRRPTRRGAPPCSSPPLILSHLREEEPSAHLTGVPLVVPSTAAGPGPQSRDWWAWG